MTDESPDVILPSRHCWEWYGHRPHEAHLIGDPPTVYRCEGFEPAAPTTEETPCPPQSPPTPSSQP